MMKLKARLTSLVCLLSIFVGVLYINILHTPAMETHKPGKSWADGPIPLVRTPVVETGKTDTWTLGASHMALLHNSLIRGYNSIYIQTPHILPADIPDFINYAYTWYKFVKAHHDTEEADLFPTCVEVLGIEDKLVWQKIHEEHKAMMPSITAYGTYLEDLKRGRERVFDKEKLMRLLEDIRGPLETHLHSEIAVIAALAKYGSFPSAEPALDAWGQRSLTAGGYLDVVPFMFLNHDAGFEDGYWRGWPPMPRVVKFLLLRVGGAWNRGWWRFASCGVDGRPRELYGLGGKGE